MLINNNLQWFYHSIKRNIKLQRKNDLTTNMESKYGNKIKNYYSHKIITKTNKNESKYGNKIGCEIIIIYRDKTFTR